MLHVMNVVTGGSNAPGARGRADASGSGRPEIEIRIGTTVMTHRDQLIEQHIRLHESHLKHIDEMLRRAHEHVEAGKAPPEAETELEDLKGERDRLAGELSEMKRRDREEWERNTLSRSGPMGVWDAVAQRLEKLMERLD